ncbi:hypothetical protein A2872_03050 [Candidatus Gottesmanbacteria bacterium RIFCSPHIGHO2_01_FULL_42_12]|uniref:Uncharacterized protein n=1 Tax=Candidatus Gottesmanbacteria bacterium RIFCSPHIGHO2_01_FULL_42_12 TaxID=1798377 RepID=A0A1F5Z024_9BACT|nr:MAG: hypothetical protein A2872_03050 [Candidatus Gottesmanbacteria bacterium RIFCSPHIGHO2_01_FULL_42_12]
MGWGQNLKEKFRETFFPEKEAESIYQRLLDLTRSSDFPQEGDFHKRTYTHINNMARVQGMVARRELLDFDKIRIAREFLRVNRPFAGRK